MLKYSRNLVELHKEREEVRRLWFPRIKLRKWLFGGEEPESMPAARRDTFTRDGGDTDEGEAASKERKEGKRRKGFREKLADFLEWAVESVDMIYAFKLALGVMLVSWPAFVNGWQLWFYHNRGGIWFFLSHDNQGGPYYTNVLPLQCGLV
jgi:hypothetical protein